MNPIAVELNEVLQKENNTIYNLLSSKGRNIFFPDKGIVAQSGDAKGKTFNATIGAAVEDDGSPMRLKVIADNIKIAPGLVFPYASSFGRDDLEKEWKEMLVKKNPELKGKKISLPLATCALTHGLSVLGYLFVNEGDKIIIPDLYWGNYNLILHNAYGAEFDKFPLFKDNGFNLAGFKEKLNDGNVGKKIILLNFPNNPTGYTPTVNEVKEIIAAIKDAAEKNNEILVLVDDAYFGLIYEEGIEKQSIFAYLADLHENVLAVKIDGATKEDYVWGLRVGFVTYGIKNGNENIYNVLFKKSAGMLRGNVSNISNLSQSLLVNAYQDSGYENEKKEKYAIMKSRYQKVKCVLNDNEKYQEYFKPLPYNSGYFMCIELNKVLNSEDVRQVLLKDYDTGVIAIPGLIRLAFSSISEDKINQLFENIYNACKEVSA